MLDQEKNIDRIEQFLQGHMSIEEEQEFSQDLKKDPALKELFEFIGDTEKAIELNEVSSLKQKLNQSEKKFSPHKNNFYILKIAASILVLASLAYFLYYTNNPDLSALYYDYYEPYPNVIEPVSRSSGGTFNNVYTLYEQRHYEDALEFFQNTLHASDTILFYQAQCQIALNKNRKALKNLESIEDDSPFYEPAQWYEALIYLKLAKKDEVRAKLDEIILQDNGYSKRAQKLKGSL